MNLRLLLRLLLDPGWAPLIVAATFLTSVPSGFAESHDYIFHLAGGAAVAFFAWRTIALIPSAADKTAPRRRLIIAFFVALAVASLWEAAEFLADGALGTSFQNEKGEALSDFSFSALGALVFTFIARALTNPARRPGDPLK